MKQAMGPTAVLFIYALPTIRIDGAASSSQIALSQMFASGGISVTRTTDLRIRPRMAIRLPNCCGSSLSPTELITIVDSGCRAENLCRLPFPNRGVASRNLDDASGDDTTPSPHLNAGIDVSRHIFRASEYVSHDRRFSKRLKNQ